MIKKEARIVENNNGVKYIINEFKDGQRTYAKKDGIKKQSILEKYSEAQQRNIIMNALVVIVDSNNVTGEEVTALKELKSFIDSL